MANLHRHFGVTSARNVLWAHAVNSRQELDAALSSDAPVHMLEADLMMAPPRTDGVAEDAVPTARPHPTLLY